jgi:hypothetical protein
MARLTVLSDPDFMWFKGLDGPRWMRKRQYRRQKQSYFQALDDQVDMLAKFGFNDPLDGTTLRELLTVLISKDGTFGAFFHDLGALDLQTQDGWKRLYNVCAGRIVEKYLEQRTAPAPQGPGYLLSEALAPSISELLDLAVTAGKLSEEEGKAAGEDFLVPPGGKPEVLEDARAALEELLATDINLAVETGDGDEEDIPKRERDSEINKSALVRLRMRDLRDIAEEEDLPLLRTKEALAGAIVRKYNADRSAIAGLVLSKLGDNPEAGHSTHLIPLAELPELDTARSRLLDLRGHYLRLQVAHWLVFTDSTGDANIVRFGGELRYYDVAAQREGGEAEIAARQRRAAVEVRLRAGVPWAEVDGRNLTEIRRMRTVFGRALGVSTKTSLPLVMPVLDGVAGTLDRHTLLMLRILETGIRDEFIDYASFTAAEFGKAQADVTEADPMKPSVRQVKLAGQHILSSTDACRLIASEGQRMATVEFRARYRENLKGKSHFSNVKISLSPDQATIMTSYGGDPTTSRRLHDEIVKRLRKSLDRGVNDAAELDGIVSQVVARAGETGEVETADILPPAGGDEIQAREATDGASPSESLPISDGAPPSVISEVADSSSPSAPPPPHDGSSDSPVP